MTPEERRVYNAAWHQANREKKKEDERAYRLKKKEEMAVDESKRAQYRERVNASIQRNRKKLRLSILEMLGNCCKGCGYSDKRALQIEHINGDGAEERRKYKDPNTCYRFIKSQIEAGSDRYQILCANCHIIKHSED